MHFVNLLKQRVIRSFNMKKKCEEKSGGKRERERERERGAGGQIVILKFKQHIGVARDFLCLFVEVYFLVVSGRGASNKYMCDSMLFLRNIT